MSVENEKKMDGGKYFSKGEGEIDSYQWRSIFLKLNKKSLLHGKVDLSLSYVSLE